VDEIAELRPVLKPAQEHVLTTLAGRDEAYFARVDYEAIAHVSRSQAAYDLADLVKLGLVERLGSGRSTRYRIVQARGGRRRKWTPERIRDELQELCEEDGRWPTATEFKDAGRGDLYLAASRYGGIEHWADELGFRKSRRPSRRRRLPLAGIARSTRAVALAALAALGLGLIAGSQMPEAPSPTSAAAPRVVLPEASTRPTPDVPVTNRSSPDHGAVDLRLAARRGDSWVSVRRGSAAGRIVWEGTLRAGRTIRLVGERLWLRLDAPGNLAARLNGERVALPARTSTVLARKAGLRVLSTAPPPEPVVLVKATPSEAEVAAPSAPASPAPSPGGTPSPDLPPGAGGPSPDPRP
jgi:Domain of unknown function (DUF4115)